MKLDRCLGCSGKFVKSKAAGPYSEFCDHCAVLLIAGAYSPSPSTWQEFDNLGGPRTRIRRAEQER